ncbi:hypothetical protein [Avibacterium paragallinarum]|uniref:Secreted protein n=1 Tax=Avibacterium paragallinarum TaxID=728 RepID=A0AAE5TJK1_AVIPA|nr:hypothetical protein [Avibacterium paragallinarum]MEE3608189.1 hypothetical protein [Avibacterium paragallinarum]MEE3621107.1 hypothetical protein [Avibacterium paragallinarum]MEE3668338.1 hypothetical protein [Avibacterium paragallinarum]MEE3680348.1 hypothetical protein [Avibacterium paragallinarum]MEE4385993.1 hypothetical protein [Avibacterium paragallinarum]
MKHKKLVFSTLAMVTFLTVMPAQAATKPIFSCSTAQGKKLLVEKAGSNYVLSYQGLKVTNPISQILERTNSHIVSRSGYVLYSLEFSDPKYSYYMQYQESMGDEKPLFAGLFRVEPNSNNDPTTLVKCSLNKPISNNFEINLMNN